MGRSCSQNGRRLECFKILTDTPTGQRFLGRPRHKWENNFRIGINMRNWVDSAQDRDYWRALVNLRVP